MDSLQGPELFIYIHHKPVYIFINIINLSRGPFFVIITHSPPSCSVLTKDWNNSNVSGSYAVLLFNSRILFTFCSTHNYFI